MGGWLLGGLMAGEADASDRNSAKIRDIMRNIEYIASRALHEVEMSKIMKHDTEKQLGTAVHALKEIVRKAKEL